MQGEELGEALGRASIVTNYLFSQLVLLPEMQDTLFRGRISLDMPTRALLYR